MRDDAPCYACELAAGHADLPGGRIAESAYWLMEHCTGPLGVGTLILKPKRHCLHLGDLSADESAELGSMLTLTASLIRDLKACEQVYACLWSHAQWQPGHIHFVVQPAGAAEREYSEQPGPSLQVAMFERNQMPDPGAVGEFCDRARSWLRDRGYPALTRAPG